MTLAVILAKICVDFLCGLSILSFSRERVSPAATAINALLIGMYAETMAVFAMVWAGAGLAFSTVALSLLTIAASTALWAKKKLHLPAFSIGKLKWYEWLLCAAIAEKIVFGLWQLVATPTYFDDAITQWSGRGRALFGGVNWSFDASSPQFLGIAGKKWYPLFTPVWRASTAVLNGGWSEVVSRADSLVFFVVLLGLLWVSARQFSGSRWLAMAGVYTLSALPLLAFHAAAGYSDVAVSAYAFAALVSVIRKNWLSAGLLAAGAAWCKNDGLAVYLPSIAIAMAVVLVGKQCGGAVSPWVKTRLKPALVFCLGVATAAPWLIFNIVNHLGFSASGLSLNVRWHPEGPSLVWRTVVNGPTHGPFWPVVSVALAVAAWRLWADQAGRALLCALLFIAGSLAFVFFFTDSFEWLSNGMTVHRSVMQLAPIALFTAIYGLSLMAGEKPEHEGLAGGRAGDA